jgi:hypothetical protein
VAVFEIRVNGEQRFAGEGISAVTLSSNCLRSIHTRSLLVACSRFKAQS